MSSVMQVVRPTPVTDAILLSSTIAEADAQVWSAGATYAAGAKVMRGHRVWESVAASNVGHDPLADASAAYWLALGATNRWKMFDEAVGSVATATGAIEVVLKPGRIDMIGVLDVIASEVTIGMTVNGTEVYRQTQSTEAGGRAIDNWYDWLFAPIGVRRRLLFNDIPSFSDGTITVRIEGAEASSVVGCGTLLIGRVFDIGKTGGDADIGIDDYSKVTRDQFGVATLLRRGWSDNNRYQVAVRSDRVDAVREVMVELRATPTLWIATDALDSGITYGWYDSFRLGVKRLNGLTIMTLSLQGLV